jgi:hypothetical protein
VHDDLLGLDELETIRNGSLPRLTRGGHDHPIGLELLCEFAGCNDDDLVAGRAEDFERPGPQRSVAEGMELFREIVPRSAGPITLAARSQDGRDGCGTDG